jgi:hypothetical protein
MSRIEQRFLPTNHISESVLNKLKIALAPEVLGKDSDRFDVGVEFQKAQIRQQLNTMLSRELF